jgi:osmotically inducible protein OsmC
MGISKASAKWEGKIMTGHGTMKPAHGADVPFSVKTRMMGEAGSNPEEMIGAALSGCFSMALSAALGDAGVENPVINTSADVHLDKDGPGFKISSIELTTVVTAAIDGEKFQAIAAETKKQCPVSKALAGTTITLKASLS